MLKDFEQDIREGAREGLCHWPDVFLSLGSETLQTVLRLRALFPTMSVGTITQEKLKTFLNQLPLCGFSWE